MHVNKGLQGVCLSHQPVQAHTMAKNARAGVRRRTEVVLSSIVSKGQLLTMLWPWEWKKRKEESGTKKKKNRKADSSREQVLQPIQWAHTTGAGVKTVEVYGQTTLPPKGCGPCFSSSDVLVHIDSRLTMATGPP